MKGERAYERNTALTRKLVGYGNSSTPSACGNVHDSAAACWHEAIVVNANEVLLRGAGVERAGERSIPIPAFEQVVNQIAEAGEKMFSVQMSAADEDLAIGRRIADFDLLFVRMDDPGGSGSARKEIGHPLIDFRARVSGRQDLDGQVGGAGKEGPCPGSESEGFQLFLWYKR